MKVIEANEGRKIEYEESGTWLMFDDQISLEPGKSWKRIMMYISTLPQTHSENCRPGKGPTMWRRCLFRRGSMRKRKLKIRIMWSWKKRMNPAPGM